jgi:hypothetical protein
MEKPLEVGLGPSGNGPYRLLRGGRTALIRRFEAAIADPRRAQETRLNVILEQVRKTRFGEASGLDRVRTLEDLRRAVPVRTYEDLRPWMDRVVAGEPQVLTQEPVLQLLETSGTTGRPKLLPVTASWAASVAEAQSLWVLAMVRDFEAVARGRSLTVVSPAAHSRSPGGLAIGSNTGRMHLAQPWYVRLRYPVPYRVFELSPAEVRQYALLRFALQAEVSSLTTANPSTVLLLSRRLLEWREPLSRDLREGTLRNGPAAGLDPWTRRILELQLRKRPVPTDWRPAKLWPLALVNCWKGGPARYFVDRLPAALGAEVPVREVGITASEGYFALPLGNDWGGGVLWTLGHVLEFLDDSDTPRWAWELEPGEKVRLVISTESGLLRYDLRDTLEVVGRCGNTPVVRFVGKTGRFLNSTGEKVSEEQVSEAMRIAGGQEQLHPIGFTARLAWGDIPTIELAFELSQDRSRLELDRLVGAFDRALSTINMEYADKRASGRIGAPAHRLLAPGTYALWRLRRIEEGAPEGQVKDPILALDEGEWARVVGGVVSGNHPGSRP